MRLGNDQVMYELVRHLLWDIQNNYTLQYSTVMDPSSWAQESRKHTDCEFHIGQDQMG